MEPVNVMSTLKVQQYLNNQNLGDDVLNFVDTLKFNSLMTDEQFNDVKDKVERYRTLDAELQRNPSPDWSGGTRRCDRHSGAGDRCRRPWRRCRGDRPGRRG